MKSSIEAIVSLTIDNLTLAALLTVVILVVGLPFTVWLSGLVRGFWSPKIGTARRMAGRVFQQLGERLSGTN
ncbi:hypothetical protein [Streptomyces collinus]|uniref:hypothetical protein n=1 Tax=Streptomyces collinus TaxID=42684 RepID=UPI0037D61466